MPSQRLGSGHRGFPFLTILGNGTTRTRHSLRALYGTEQTGRERPSAHGGEEQLGAPHWAERVGCSEHLQPLQHCDCTFTHS